MQLVPMGLYGMALHSANTQRVALAIEFEALLVVGGDHILDLLGGPRVRPVVERRQIRERRGGIHIFGTWHAFARPGL